MSSPFGSWSSPFTAAAVAGAAPRIDGARFVGDEVWWGESVPEEAGRTAVRRMPPSGQVSDVIDAPWSARSRVHEYGGGAWTTVAGDALVFVEKADQRVWKAAPGERPKEGAAQTLARFAEAIDED